MIACCVRVIDLSNRILVSRLVRPVLWTVPDAMSEDYPLAIVDDDDSMREAATNLLRSLGVPVIAFASAEDYLESGWMLRTSCLLLDVQMPRMDGLTLQSYLMANDVRVPIVFVTAFEDDRAKRQALGAGAVGFILKPFTDINLIETLRSAGCMSHTVDVAGETHGFAHQSRSGQSRFRGAAHAR